MTRTRIGAVVAAASLLLAACGSEASRLERSADAAVIATTTTTSSTTTTTTSTSTPPTSTRPASRFTETGFAPFAFFDDVVLVHPSPLVEIIGFHESGHDGARQLEIVETAVRPVVLESRERDTGSRTAADMVVPPDTEIRSPVTGTVKRAGSYILYCQYHDDFAVIEPDAHPGWEVKLLHIDGVQVRAGDRVESGVTLIAPRATVLPFESQVNELTADPSTPHVHMELVDPSIPDRPTPTPGCS